MVDARIEAVLRSTEVVLRRHASKCVLGVRHLTKIEIAKKLVDSNLDDGIPQRTSREKGEAADKLREQKLDELRSLAKAYGIPAWAATHEDLVCRILEHEEWLDRQDGTDVVLRPRSSAAKRAARRVVRTYNGPGNDGGLTLELQLTFPDVRAQAELVMEHNFTALREFAAQHGITAKSGGQPSKDLIAFETVRRGLVDKLPPLDRRLHTTCKQRRH